MKLSTSIISFLSLTAVYAAPTKRQAAVTDADILQFALTLEHLEAKFYADAVAKFTTADFTAAGFESEFYDNLREVATNEATHVTFLTSALTAAGAMPVSACTYSFPYTDAKSFVSLSKVLEGVGVSAYLGAAPSISMKEYLSAAGAILTVEARHNSYFSDQLGYSPFPQPFDTALSPNAIYTMASAFITSCPSTNAKLPFMAFPALTMVSTNPQPGQPMVFSTTGDLSKAKFCTFVSELSMYYSPFSGNTCIIPSEITAGQNYVFLTMTESSADSEVVAGPTIITM